MLSSVENKAGFFKKQHVQLCKAVSQDEVNKFSSLTSDSERFAFVHDLKEKLGGFIVELEETSKNVETAEKRKNDGNLAFKAGDMTTAIGLYTKSLMKYPHDQENKQGLAIVYANRSAALFHLKEYKLCIKDIQLALQNEYPKYMQYKILERKARSLLAMKQNKSALDAFRRTFVSLDDAKLSAEQRRKLQTDVQIMMAMMNKDKNIADKELQEVKSEEFHVDNGINEAYPCISSAVTFKASDKLGRYGVAQKDIAAGRRILVESPYSSVLMEINSLTHCQNCFKRFTAPVPCDKCSNIAFCSVPCQRAALNSYHRYECKILRSLWASGASITCLIALRIVTQNSIQYFKQLKPSLQQSVEISSKNKFLPSDYLNIYNMVRHEATRAPEDLLHRSHMAVLLFKSLQASGYFHQSEETNGLSVMKLTDDEVFIGGLILRHLQLLQFNVHEVSELIVPKKAGLNDGNGKYLGAAIFPTLALLNHSCDPSIVRYFDGTKVIVNTIKKIKVGEMIAENYGPIFTCQRREERRKILKDQYWFDCECTPCIENWPSFNEMSDNDNMRFQCETKSCSNVISVPTKTMEFLITCQVCKRVTNIIKGLKALRDTDSKFEEGEKFLERGNVKKALNTFLDLLKILDETLAPPFKGYHLCQQAIKTCYLHMGNKYLEARK